MSEGDFGRLNTRYFGSSVGRAAVGVLLFAFLTMSVSKANAHQGVFFTTGSLNDARDNHNAILLNDGKVLIAGGMGPSGIVANNFSIASAELYDPSTGTFALTGSMNNVRQNHTATLLNNGKVLIVGGEGVAASPGSAELYDPTTGTFTVTGNLNAARQNHTATLLNNGKVLIVGGADGSLNSLASAELYDPTTGTFTVTGSLNSARYYHTATLLSNGMVLVAGGETVIASTSSQTPLASAELYDPTTGTFTPTGSMSNSHSQHTATLLNNNTVLVAGGFESSIGVIASAELYDSTTGTFTPTGSMSNSRSQHTATLLNNGTVLVAGGYGSGFQTSAELYDPRAGTFTVTGSLSQARDSHTATLLNNQTVLVAGGFVFTNAGQELASAELYVSVVLSPSNLAFVSQPQNITSAPQTVTLTNNQTTALSITSVSLIGTDATDFAETDNCLASLAAAASCTMNVTFTPTAQGPRMALLSIVNSEAIRLIVALAGTGTPAVPIVSLSPTNLVFASPAVGTPSVPQTVTLTNTGSASLNIQTVALGFMGAGGTNASNFSIAAGSTCTNGATVPASGSCLLGFIYTPKTPNTVTTAVTITDNAADSPQFIDLSGSLPIPQISPSKVSFSPQYVGTSGLPQSVTVTNNSGGTLNISSVTVSPSDFGTLNACGNTVAPNTSCTIGVFFDPTTGGSRTGTLTITDNGTGSTQTVALSGTGQDFSMAAASGSTTVSPGQTANFSVAVSPAGGFTQSVALSCSGGPALSTCAVSPSMVTLNGSAATMVTVAITTTAALPPQSAPFAKGGHRLVPLTNWLWSALIFLILIGLRRWPMGYRPSLAYALAVLLVFSAALGLVACGGGSSGSTPGNPQTPAGTYSVVVSGAFTSGSTNLKHSANLTVVVQ
jgi:hypothetical protein